MASAGTFRFALKVLFRWNLPATLGCVKLFWKCLQPYQSLFGFSWNSSGFCLRKMIEPSPVIWTSLKASSFLQNNSHGKESLWEPDNFHTTSEEALSERILRFFGWHFKCSELLMGISVIKGFTQGTHTQQNSVPSFLTNESECRDSEYFFINSF